ncbi:MAG: hypothetical protein U0Y08_05650 [Bacteroidia bacterium]
MKTDMYGIIQWQNTIGGSNMDILNSVKPCPDGGYILGGTSWSDISGDKTEGLIGGSLDCDYWVVKITSSGGIQWQNTIGGGTGDLLTNIELDNNGGYVLGGYSGSGISGDKNEVSQNSDVWLVALDSIGGIIWQKTLGGGGDELLYSFEKTNDGGFVLGVTTDSIFPEQKQKIQMVILTSGW